MTNIQDLPVASGDASQPIARLAFLGPAPLIEGEDASGYDELLARVSGTLQPSDIIEEIWVRDVVDLVWDAFRLRRLKADLMTAAAYEGMTSVLKPLFRLDYADMARGWCKRTPAVVEMVEAALQSAGLTMEAVRARTFSVRITDFERIDRMTMAAEARRNAVLREIERHRANFAENLRRTIRHVEDAELKLVAPGNAGSEEAA